MSPVSNFARVFRRRGLPCRPPSHCGVSARATRRRAAKKNAPLKTKTDRPRDRCSAKANPNDDGSNSISFAKCFGGVDFFRRKSPTYGKLVMGCKPLPLVSFGYLYGGDSNPEIRHVAKLIGSSGLCRK